MLRTLTPTLLLAVLVAAPALALKSDRQQPMDVQADSWEGALDEGRQVLTGNVRISQGSMEVEADRAVVIQGERRIRSVLLTGDPAVLSQDLDDGSGRMTARARSIDYQLDADQIILTGDVVIVQPSRELRGERVIYELESGRLRADGEGSGPVRIRIEPTP